MAALGPDQALCARSQPGLNWLKCNQCNVGALLSLSAMHDEWHCRACSAMHCAAIASCKWRTSISVIVCKPGARLLNALYMQDVAAQDSSAAAGGGAAGSGSVGRFRALVDTIIGNLELKISNIHIRYEDSSSNQGHTFCIGVLLSEISAHTVGEDWQRKFVTADALLTLRKVSTALWGPESHCPTTQDMYMPLQQQDTPTSGVCAAAQWHRQRPTRVQWGPLGSRVFGHACNRYHVASPLSSSCSMIVSFDVVIIR